MNSSSEEVVIALDLGGSWIKGLAAPLQRTGDPGIPSLRRPNPAPHQDQAEEFAQSLCEICSDLADGRHIRQIVASTAGEVTPSGKGYRVSGAHLGVMSAKPWLVRVEKTLGAPVELINDADAFMLGCAERGLVSPDETVAAVVLGTGVGFSVVREGRWSKPFRRTILLGSFWGGEQTYDQLLSCVPLAESVGGDLSVFFASERFSTARESYLKSLARGLATAAIANHPDRILVGGGLVDAAASAHFDLVKALEAKMVMSMPPKFSPPALEIVRDANDSTLEGALALGRGNVLAEPHRCTGHTGQLRTESTLPGTPVEDLTATGIVSRLAENELAASRRFLDSIPALTRSAERIRSAIHAGGRVIYLGAGTSGRMGAIDAVEIPCTFGEPPSRFVSIVAGGLADASFNIEEDGEEDLSSVSDFLLLQPDSRDVVIGISASATAFFVRSGLAFARSRGAHTILIHESGMEETTCFDDDIPLGSGGECIQGSTRMLAGTATKKALNILSTTAMILLGKVRRGCMIDMVASNDKLRRRAILILTQLTGLDEAGAATLLESNGYHLRAALADTHEGPYGVRDEKADPPKGA